MEVRISAYPGFESRYGIEQVVGLFFTLAQECLELGNVEETEIQLVDATMTRTGALNARHFAVTFVSIDQHEYTDNVLHASF